MNRLRRGEYGDKFGHKSNARHYCETGQSTEYHDLKSAVESLQGSCDRPA